MRGNLLHKGPMADNTTAVAYGAERNMWTTNTVTLTHNTVVTTMGRGTFISLRRLYAAGHAHGEPLCRQRRARERDCSALLVQQSNFMTGEGNVPGAATGNFWPIAAIQPQLVLGSPCRPASTPSDSPQPFRAARARRRGQRLIGALQSAP